MSEIKCCPSCAKYKNVHGMVQQETHGKYRYWRCGDCKETWMEPNELLKLQIGTSSHKIDQLETKLAIAKEALEFYASDEAWYKNESHLTITMRSIVYKDTETDDSKNPWIIKGGKAAREALKKINEE